jgi:hypothetical protein
MHLLFDRLASAGFYVCRAISARLTVITVSFAFTILSRTDRRFYFDTRRLGDDDESFFLEQALCIYH